MYHGKASDTEFDNSTPHVFAREAGRGKKRKRRPEPRQLSHTPDYVEDLKKYQHRADVIELSREIEGHLKDRNDVYLEIHHDAHALDREYEGFWSLKLYPGERGENDILILYQFHENGNHVTFRKIGNHAHVYKKKRR